MSNIRKISFLQSAASMAGFWMLYFILLAVMVFTSHDPRPNSVFTVIAFMVVGCIAFWMCGRHMAVVQDYEEPAFEADLIESNLMSVVVMIGKLCGSFLVSLLAGFVGSVRDDNVAYFGVAILIFAAIVQLINMLKKNDERMAATA